MVRLKFWRSGKCRFTLSLPLIPGPLRSWVMSQLYGFKHFYLIQKICKQFYGFKYSYTIQIICIQLYAFKGFLSNIYNLHTVIWFQVFLSNTNNLQAQVMLLNIICIVKYSYLIQIIFKLPNLTQGFKMCTIKL